MRLTKKEGEILLDLKCRDELDSALAVKRKGIPRKGVGVPCCCVCYTPSMYACLRDWWRERGKIWHTQNPQQKYSVHVKQKTPPFCSLPQPSVYFTYICRCNTERWKGRIWRQKMGRWRRAKSYSTVGNGGSAPLWIIYVLIVHSLKHSERKIFCSPLVT